MNKSVMSHTNQTVIAGGSPAIWWCSAIAPHSLVTGNRGNQTVTHSHQGYCSGSSFYLPHIICHFTDHFAWCWAAQQLLLFHIAVSQVSHILFQCITVNSRLLLAMFKEGAGNVFLWLADMSSHLTKNAVHCSSEFCWCN